MAPGKFITEGMWWILRSALLYAAICLTNNHESFHLGVSITSAVLVMKTCPCWRSVCKHPWSVLCVQDSEEFSRTSKCPFGHTMEGELMRL